MRILMTGSRGWEDTDAIRKAILIAVEYIKSKRSEKGDFTPVEFSDITLIHGTAAGADVLAGEVAKDLGMMIEEHPADWQKHNDDCPDVKPPYKSCWQGKERCSRAGHRRNQEMIDSGADVILAFILNESPGATGCLKLAHKVHMPSIVSRETTFDDEELEPVKTLLTSLPGFDSHGKKINTLW